MTFMKEQNASEKPNLFIKGGEGKLSITSSDSMHHSAANFKFQVSELSISSKASYFEDMEKYIQGKVPENMYSKTRNKPLIVAPAKTSTVYSHYTLKSEIRMMDAERRSEFKSKSAFDWMSIHEELSKAKLCFNQDQPPL